LPIKFNIVYRRANNPFIDKIIQHFRKVDNVTFLPKGKYGAKNIIDAIKRKEVVIMLVDQRLRDGIAVPFFNINAMTPPAIASLALKYQLPISSIYCQRVKNKQGDKFNIHVNKPINIKLTGQKDQDIYNIMSYINKQIELWINEQPGQWFWIHDRWSAVKTHI
jgi:KDO2-lipid IV(A) lauroyltransferase